MNLSAYNGGIVMSDRRSLEELEDFIEERVEEDMFSGAVLIAKEDAPFFKKAYGLASKRFGATNRVDTKFNIGSLNKMFTQVAIAQLAEKGRVEYDVPIKGYLPDYPPDVASKVNIDHLLNFTSGMGHYWNERFYASMGRLRRVDDFVSLFVDEPLAFEPGERYQYSNNGYVLLGKIVEAVSKTNYYDYIRENIYEPAGMKDSDHYELDAPVPNLATGYTRIDEQWRPVPGPRRSNLFIIGVKGSPAGGGYSTVEDLLRFDIALRENRLLGPDYTSTTFPTKPKEDGKPNVMIRAGGAPGVSAFFQKFPDFGYTAIVLSNYDPDDSKVVADRIRDLVLGTSSSLGRWR
jgi:D-alanyl-D-alanine carboxypeptidase